MDWRCRTTWSRGSSLRWRLRDSSPRSSPGRTAASASRPSRSTASNNWTRHAPSAGFRSRERLANRQLADMLESVLLGAGLVLVLAGALSFIYPLRWVGIRTRGIALLKIAGGFLLVAVAHV